MPNNRIFLVIILILLPSTYSFDNNGLMNHDDNNIWQVLELGETEEGDTMKRKKPIKCVIRRGTKEKVCKSMINAGCPFRWLGKGCEGFRGSGGCKGNQSCINLPCVDMCLKNNCVWNGKSCVNPPTKSPTFSPTSSPTTKSPTSSPTQSPTKSPTSSPTQAPTKSPTSSPTQAPTKSPTSSPTKSPSKSPTISPTFSPTSSPTHAPTKSPILSPTKSPTQAPTKSPT